jgi:serine/threonine protein kinase
MPGTVILDVVKGPIQGQAFTFEEHDTFIFGRSPDCHARLPAEDPTAFRHHFILEVNPPDARIRDLGSLNGTYVNDVKYGGRARGETPEEAAERKFPDMDLKDGDVIRVGETVMTVHVEVPALCCGGKRSLQEAGSIMLDALEGLAFAHEQGFVHRDLKPQNILLTAQDSGEAKVSDFGLAKSFQKAGFSGMTATGGTAGTYPFMAREQLTNFKFVKPVSDVWSMGATFYFMLTGGFPRDFRRGQDPMEVILRGGVVPIRNRDSSIPKNIGEVIDRACADNVKERYQTAGEFRQTLARVL